MSVKEYLETLIAKAPENSEYEKAEPLAKAIYNYGYYAMKAVRGGTKHPAMPGTYANDSALITSLEGYAIQKSIDTEVITDATYSLDLESETAINFYLTTDTFLSKDNVAVSAENATFEYTVENTGERWRVKITGIGAHELCTVFTMKTGNTSISASALTYVQNALAYSGSSEETKHAAAALYAYYTETVNYRK